MKIKFASTIRNYSWKNFPKDLIAGIITSAVSIPISMGYAQIAGLPAVYGLYGSVFPILMFALFSTSPQFIFGVDAAPAALVGSALLTMEIESGSAAAEADGRHTWNGRTAGIAGTDICHGKISSYPFFASGNCSPCNSDYRQEAGTQIPDGSGTYGGRCTPDTFLSFSHEEYSDTEQC